MPKKRHGPLTQKIRASMLNTYHGHKQAHERFSRDAKKNSARVTAPTEAHYIWMLITCCNKIEQIINNPNHNNPQDDVQILINQFITKTNNPFVHDHTQTSRSQSYCIMPMSEKEHDELPYDLWTDSFHVTHMNKPNQRAMTNEHTYIEAIQTLFQQYPQNSPSRRALHSEAFKPPGNSNRQDPITFPTGVNLKNIKLWLITGRIPGQPKTEKGSQSFSIRS